MILPTGTSATPYYLTSDSLSWTLKTLPSRSQAKNGESEQRTGTPRVRDTQRAEGEWRYRWSSVRTKPPTLSPGIYNKQIWLPPGICNEGSIYYAISTIQCKLKTVCSGTPSAESISKDSVRPVEVRCVGVASCISLLLMYHCYSGSQLFVAASLMAYADVCSILIYLFIHDYYTTEQKVIPAASIVPLIEHVTIIQCLPM